MKKCSKEKGCEKNEDVFSVKDNIKSHIKLLYKLIIKQKRKNILFMALGAF